MTACTWNSAGPGCRSRPRSTRRASAAPPNAWRSRAWVPHGIEVRLDHGRHRLDLPVLTGGRTVTIYARTEIVQDLVALQLADRPPLLFRTEALGVEGRSAGDRWCPSSTTATRKGRPASRWSAAAVRRGFRDISRHVFHASTAHADPPGTRARVPVLLAGCPGRSPAALRGVDPHTRRGRLHPATYARPGRTRRALGDRRRPQPGTRTGHRQVRALPARSRPRADAPRARCCSPGTPPAWCRRQAPRASTTRCPTFASRPARSSTRTKAERHNSSTATRSCASTGSGDRPASRTTRPGCRASGRRARLRPRSQDRPAAPDHCAPADGRRTGRPCTGLPSARRTGRLTDRSARPAPAARRRPCGPRPCPAHGPAR